MDHPQSILRLDEDGQLWWSLLNSTPSSSSKLQLTQGDAGIAVISKSSIPKSTITFSNYAIASVLMDWNEADICMHCWQLINKAPKISNKCRHLRYCSQDCLRANEHYILRCGKAVNSIVKRKDSTPIETQLLALNLLYRLTVTTEASEVQQISYIFNLCCQVGKDIEEVNQASGIFYSILSSDAEDLLEEVQWFMKFDLEQARLLFRIMRLNCQPMYLYGMKRYTVLCLLPTIARINHSCQPNCELVVQIVEEGTEEELNNTTCSKSALLFARQVNNTQRELYRPRRLLKVSVLAVTDLASDSELTISYLSNLYEDIQTRRHYLSQGFYFSCNCSRCIRESSLDHNAAGDSLDRMMERQVRLDALLATDSASLPSNAPSSLVIDRCEFILQLCEGLMQDIGQLGRESQLAWSPASIYHACLLVIEDYQSRFRRFQGQWSDYISYGLLFFRAGKIMCECWTRIQSPARPARLDLMTKVCLHSALATKPFLELRSELSQYGLFEKVQAMVRGALALSVETTVLIDSIYLTNESLRERESEVGTDDNSTLGDSWHYLRLLRDKAVRVRSYLRTAADRLNES
jgi:hypothetical protein